MGHIINRDELEAARAIVRLVADTVPPDNSNGS